MVEAMKMSSGKPSGAKRGVFTDKEKPQHVSLLIITKL